MLNVHYVEDGGVGRVVSSSGHYVEDGVVLSSGHYVEDGGVEVTNSVTLAAKCMPVQ